MVFYIDNDHRVVMTSEIDEGHEIKVGLHVPIPHVNVSLGFESYNMYLYT